MSKFYEALSQMRKNHEVITWLGIVARIVVERPNKKIEMLIFVTICKIFRISLRGADCKKL